MMANSEHVEFEFKSSLCEENEATQPLREVATFTQTVEGNKELAEVQEVVQLCIEPILLLFTEDTTMAPSFGDERSFWGEGPAAGNTSPSSQDKRMFDEKIFPTENQLQYLLNKADEIQTQLLWSQECLQNYDFVHIVPTFLQTCQSYFTELESTARNSNPFHPPLSTYIRTQLLQFSQQLCSRLEQLMLLYASFSFVSLDESDPLSISHFYIGQCQIDNMKLSIFRYCCPTPFLATASTGLYKRMRWNVEREIQGGEGKTFDSAEFYFLCCEDVIEAHEDSNGEGTCEGENTEREKRVARIWSIGQWVQTYPDPEDITDWVLCSVPCGQYKQLLCLGIEEPSSCTATDYLLGVLLSPDIDGTFSIQI